MIRVAMLDRQPAVRAGIDSVLRAQPDLVPVGSAEDEHALWPLLRRTRPDVVVLDDPGLIRRVKSRLPSPKVVVFGSTAGGADGLVGRTADLRILLDAIRAVVHRDLAMPAAA